jgi:hypothetical protein
MSTLPKIIAIGRDRLQQELPADSIEKYLAIMSGASVPAADARDCVARPLLQHNTMPDIEFR